MNDYDYAYQITQIPLLDENETNYLLQKVANGDKEDRNKLIKHNLRLVLKIANNFKESINLPIEELINIGVFGLIKSIDKFDFERNAKLSTFATTSISNCFKQYIKISKRKTSPAGTNISLQDVIYQGEDGEEFTVENAIKDNNPSVEDVIIEKIGNQQLKTILKYLTKEEQEILLLRYGIEDGIPHALEEIGKIYHLTRERIRQKEQKALIKLRNPKISKNIKGLLK